MAETFCILPWLHTHIEADGRVFPCCLATQEKELGNLQTDDLNTILNSDNYKSIRKDMLGGVPVKACSHCYKMEECGTRSLRQISNEEFKKDISSQVKQTLEDGTLRDPLLTSLDLRFSNACNFKCRTCNPESSSSWYEDHNNLTGEKKFTSILRPAKSREDFWEMLDPLLPVLEKIYIVGGEPLLEPDHYLMLEKLIQLNNTRLSLTYSTNFSATALGNKNVFDYWRSFSDVKLLLSYDGFGEKGEYIRKGMDWTKIQDNHRKLQTHPHIRYIITPTVSVLNAFHLPELITHLIEEKLITDGSQLGLNILQEPAFYNINIFNQDEKKSLAKIYQIFIEHDLSQYHLINKEQIVHQLLTALNYLQNINENEIHERKKFLSQTVFLDKKRQEKLLSLFPELIGFYQ